MSVHSALCLPPYTITPVIVNLVAEISEAIGRYTVLAEQNQTPLLRRGKRLRTIQALLAVENNTLSLEQVTAVTDGKRVLEIQEVRNALPPMRRWIPGNQPIRPCLHLAIMERVITGHLDEFSACSKAILLCDGLRKKEKSV